MPSPPPQLNAAAIPNVTGSGQRTTVRTRDATTNGGLRALILSDEQLAAAIVGGNAHALEELFSRYERPVVRYLQRLTHDADVAEDLFQDAFLRAYANLRAFDPRRPFRPWLYRIATNAALDWLRRQGRMGMAPEPASGERSPETVVAERDLERRVELAVSELSADHRTVFILRHYQGLDYGEIAHICGSPEGTVRSRMHYAIRALREKLRGLFEDGDGCG
jgi:RNA polymerase sigma-70 factor, ECF subfamily